MKSPKEIVQLMMNDDTFSKWLGIEIDFIDNGICNLRAEITAEMLNGFSIAHGGIAYSLADSALAFASNSHGIQSVSIETNISHLLPVREGDELTTSVEELNLTNRTGLYAVAVRNQDSKVVAYFKGTVYRTGKEWDIK